MTEPEPSGWELMRAIESLRKSVDSAVAGMVTQATLAIYQQAQKEKDDRQDARIRDLEQAQDERRKARETEQTEQRTTRSRQNFGIILALLTGVIGLVGALILRGIPV